MKRFIEGEDRGQGTQLPELLEDNVAEDNPVRVVEFALAMRLLIHRPPLG